MPSSNDLTSSSTLGKNAHEFCSVDYTSILFKKEDFIARVGRKKTRRQSRWQTQAIKNLDTRGTYLMEEAILENGCKTRSATR
jgi:hypothetical protein